MNIQSGFAEVNGAKLYYEISGAGEPLVLVHGFSLDRRMWDSQVEAFSERYQVIRYDLRGFGKSSLPEGTDYQHSDDLAALLTVLGISQAHLVGLSVGGAVVLNAALAHRELAKSLVLVDAVLPGFNWSAAQSAMDGAVWETGGRSGAEAAKALWLDHPLFAPAQRNPQASAALKEIIAGYSGWHFVNHDPQHYPDPPAIQRLHTITAPTLVVVGELDLPDFLAIGQTLAHDIRDAREVVLQQVGHMSNMEAPSKFNEAVLEFLGQLKS